jgi:hypothetical protein
MVSVPVLVALSGLLAVTTIYFVWVRKPAQPGQDQK